MAAAARELGHEYIVLTDHSPRLKIANGLSAERLREQLKVVDTLNEELAPFRIHVPTEDGTVIARGLRSTTWCPSMERPVADRASITQITSRPFVTTATST